MHGEGTGLAQMRCPSHDNCIMMSSPCDQEPAVLACLCTGQSHHWGDSLLCQGCWVTPTCLRRAGASLLPLLCPFSILPQGWGTPDSESQALMLTAALLLPHRPAQNDGRLHGHGGGHHPLRLDHRCAGLLLGPRPYAVCGRASLPHGR